MSVETRAVASSETEVSERQTVAGSDPGVTVSFETADSKRAVHAFHTISSC